MKSDPSQNGLKRNWILEEEESKDGKESKESSSKALFPNLASPDPLPPDTQITFSSTIDPDFCSRCKSIHRINPRCLFHHKAGNIVIHEE